MIGGENVFLTVAGRCSSSLRGATWGNGCNHLVGNVHELDLLLQQGSYVHSSVIYRTLKKCIAEKNLALGKRVHALTVSCGHASNLFLSNHIICMYGSLGRLDESSAVFAQVPTPDRFMWASNTLVHVRNEQPVEAITLYRRMRGSSIKPDNHVFAARMCDDCHSATKVLSRVERREIVVRDSHRVHSFSNGNCSCGDRP